MASRDKSFFRGRGSLWKGRNPTPVDAGDALALPPRERSILPEASEDVVAAAAAPSPPPVSAPGRDALIEAVRQRSDKDKYYVEALQQGLDWDALDNFYALATALGPHFEEAKGAAVVDVLATGMRTTATTADMVAALAKHPEHAAVAEKLRATANGHWLHYFTAPSTTPGLSAWLAANLEHKGEHHEKDDDYAEDWRVERDDGADDPFSSDYMKAHPPAAAAAPAAAAVTRTPLAATLDEAPARLEISILRWFKQQAGKAKRAFASPGNPVTLVPFESSVGADAVALRDRIDAGDALLSMLQAESLADPNKLPLLRQECERVDVGQDNLTLIERGKDATEYILQEEEVTYTLLRPRPDGKLGALGRNGGQIIEIDVHQHGDALSRTAVMGTNGKLLEMIMRGDAAPEATLYVRFAGDTLRADALVWYSMRPQRGEKEEEIVFRFGRLGLLEAIYLITHYTQLNASEYMRQPAAAAATKEVSAPRALAEWLRHAASDVLEAKQTIASLLQLGPVAPEHVARTIGLNKALAQVLASRMIAAAGAPEAKGQPQFDTLLRPLTAPALRSATTATRALQNCLDGCCGVDAAVLQRELAPLVDKSRNHARAVASLLSLILHASAARLTFLADASHRVSNLWRDCLSERPSAVATVITWFD